MDEKQEIRRLFYKAKIYRVFALIFAFAGLAVFGAVFADKAQTEGVWKTLANPLTIIFVILPFLPGIVLSWIANRIDRNIENKVQALMDEKNKNS